MYGKTGGYCVGDDGFGLSLATVLFLTLLFTAHVVLLGLWG